MKAVTVIQVDLETGAQGLPALLTEDLAGEPVLRRTVSRAAAAQLPDACVVLVESEEVRARVCTLLDGVSAEVCTVPGADVAHRETLRRSRRWARNGWRGGIGGTTVFDEEGTPAKLLAVCRSTGADAVVALSPAAPLIDPETIDGLLRWVVEQGASSEFYFTNLPPGLSAALYSACVLEKLVALGRTVHQALVYQTGRPGRDPAEGQCCYAGDDLLRMTPFRLSADSPRTLERLRAVCHDDTGTAVRKLKETPTLWAGRLPEEVEIEIAAPPDGTDPYDALTDRVEMTSFMDLDAFTSAVGELGAMGDVNVTFGGVGDPLAHPRFFEFVSSARRSGVCGLHLVTSGRRLDDRTVERLADSDLDAVTVRLWADTEDTFERVTGRRGLERAATGVRRLLDRRRALGRATPFVIPEMMKSVETVGEVEGFFDRWYGTADWAVIRGFNDYAGQAPDRNVLHPYPGVRFPCLQLFRRLNVTAGGRALVCGQDVLRRRAVGSVFETGFETVWHGETLKRMRTCHAAGDYGCFELCGRCRHWYQL